MTERPDYLPIPPEERAERERLSALQRAVNRVMTAAGETSDAVHTLRLETAKTKWRHIPSDSLMAVVERAILVHGARKVTVELVAEVWRGRHRKLRPDPEEVWRRRKLAEEKADKIKASPEEWEEFCQSVRNQLTTK